MYTGVCTRTVYKPRRYVPKYANILVEASETLDQNFNFLKSLNGRILIAYTYEIGLDVRAIDIIAE